jgi:hypothetical protein
MAGRFVIGGDSGLDYACGVLRPKIESTVESLFAGAARSAQGRTFIVRSQCGIVSGARILPEELSDVKR